MDKLHQIMRLRLAVAFLGEKDQHSWWKSSFLTPLGFRVMERLTPRTPKVACFLSSSQAAMRVHDAAIGKGGVVHLFRLPTEFEQDLHGNSSGWEQSGLPDFSGSTESAEKFLSSLAAKSSSSTQTSLGPTHLGSMNDWASPAALSKMAGVYLAAFRAGTPAFPYFA